MDSIFKSNFYGRRKGRRKKKIDDHVWRATLETFSIHRWTDKWPTPLWLEIGFGFGEHLVSWLARHPQRYAIGVEVFESGLIHCIENLTHQAHRCSVFPAPVEDLLPFLPNEVVDGIWILFPDPWPKKRHHKRRLIQPAFLEACYRILKPQGRIHFASDHAELVEFVFDQFDRYGKFEWKKGAPTPEVHTWPAWPENWGTSRYHQKALACAKPCAPVVWEKRES